MENYIQLLNQELQARGLNSEDEVYLKFEEFVTNKDLLKKRIALGDLQYEYNYYIEFIENGAFEDLLKKIIYEFNNALSTDCKAAKEVFKELYKQQVHMGEIWTKHNKLLNSLVLEDLREDEIYINAIDYIGQIAEAVIKPYVRFLNKCHKISLNKNLSNSDFGVELQYLFDKDETYVNCFKTILLNRKLSDWRNVSDHSSYLINTESVKVTFGRGDSKEECDFTIEEIKYLAKVVEVIAYSLKIGYEMVKNDLDEEVVNEMNNRSEYKRRDDITAQLVSTAMVMGFKVIDIKWDAKELWLEEMHNDKKRLQKILSILVYIFDGFKYFILSRQKVHYVAEFKNGRFEINEYKV